MYKETDINGLDYLYVRWCALKFIAQFHYVTLLCIIVIHKLVYYHLRTWHNEGLSIYIISLSRVIQKLVYNHLITWHNRNISMDIICLAAHWNPIVMHKFAYLLHPSSGGATLLNGVSLDTIKWKIYLIYSLFSALKNW